MASEQCVLCGGSLVRLRRYAFKTAIFREVYSDRNVYRCTRCGLKQCAHRRLDATKLDTYYRTQYRAIAQISQTDLGAKSPWFVARGKAIAGMVREHQGGLGVKRVFELGAGYGANLLAVQDAFPDAELFSDEIDASITLQPQIKHARLADGGYDVLILSHVLEHFIDPVSILKLCFGALNANGLLIVEVPNSQYDRLGIGGHDEPHVSFFTRETLQRAMAEVAGFSCLCCYACGPRDSGDSIFKILKRVARRVVTQNPAILKLARRLKRAYAITPVALDFATPREQGIFLRGAYRKTN